MGYYALGVADGLAAFILQFGWVSKLSSGIYSIDSFYDTHIGVIVIMVGQISLILGQVALSLAFAVIITELCQHFIRCIALLLLFKDTYPYLLCSHPEFVGSRGPACICGPAARAWGPCRSSLGFSVGIPWLTSRFQLSNLRYQFCPLRWSNLCVIWYCFLTSFIRSVNHVASCQLAANITSSISIVWINYCASSCIVSHIFNTVSGLSVAMYMTGSIFPCFMRDTCTLW